MKEQDNQSEVIIYQGENGAPNLQVRIENETVWLNQQQMAELFQTSKQNISQHIKNIFEEGELEQNSTVKNFFTVQREGSREVKREIENYNLDVIISVGYRVKSIQGTRFRQWATARLREYMVKGFTMDDQRLKGAGAEKDFMGLTTFAGALPTLAEVSIAKNYLTEEELFRLNRLVSAFFDLAEIKAQEQVKMTMADWVKELDKFSENFGKGVLKDAGSISHNDAAEKAKTEYRKFQAKTLSPVEVKYLETIKAIEKQVGGGKKF